MRNPNELFIQDYQAETERIVRFIQDRIAKSPRKKAIIGLSGGVDSSVAASLCCRALGPENVHAVIMPAPNTSRESTDDAYKQANELKIPPENVHQKSITRALAAFGYTEENFQERNDRAGNVAARLRMIRLFDVADEVDAVVCGTENRTEHLLGYFTTGGDEISHFEPTQHLYKEEIYGLAKYLDDVLQKIIDKEPSAELYRGQTDEGDLEFTLRDADIVFVCLDLFKDCLAYGVLPSTMDKILDRNSYTTFKRIRPYHLKR